MTLKQLIDALILLETQNRGVNGEMLVEVRIDNSDHYASGNYERREIRAVDSDDRVVLHC